MLNQSNITAQLTAVRSVWSAVYVVIFARVLEGRDFVVDIGLEVEAFSGLQ